VCPAPLGGILAEQQTQNEIQFALQCYCPYLFVPVECTHSERFAIYELFILGQSANPELVEENIHYFIFDPTIPTEYIASESTLPLSSST
jgi:hypothetical protein